MFELTLPPQEEMFLRSQYASTQVILEYGSGGSTFLALKSNSRSKIYACETDEQWLLRLCHEIDERGLSDRFTPVLCDIGPTRVWGNPCFEQRGTDLQRMNLFMNYSIRPWRLLRQNNESPSVVLIDGRFRVACFLTALSFIEANTLVLFDDYTDRPHYHCVEEFVKPTLKIGRMAVFHVKPGMITATDYLLFNKYLLDWR